MHVHPPRVLAQSRRPGQFTPSHDPTAGASQRLKKGDLAISEVVRGKLKLKVHKATVGPSRFADVDLTLRLCFVPIGGFV